MIKSHLRNWLILLAIIPLQMFAQNINIKGKVTDKNSGEALPGVSIVLVNSKAAGTITDMNGSFSLSIPLGTKLHFSYIGYENVDIQVSKDKFLNVVLNENSTEINEVVVVGAVIKKSDLTGSAVRVTSEQLKDIPTSNINQAIQGKIPGVYIENSPRPGSNASIKIRGSNSIQYGQSPIFVVDNVMIDGGFDMINPDDIATIDVLKDASATALYGARGANGVVVITTKKGKKGIGKITYDTWFGNQSFTKQMPLLSAKDLYNFRVDAYANTYMDKNPTKDRNAYIASFLTNTNPLRNIAFSKDELTSYANGQTYDWLSQIVQEGRQQNHSVSFSGGSDKGSYFMSVAYNNQIGQILKTGYSRYSGKVNLEQEVKSWLKIGTNNSYVYTDQQPVGNDNMFITSLTASPLLPISKDYWYMKSGKIDNQSTSNPLRDLDIIKDNLQNRLLSSSFVNINPLKDLNLRSTFSLDMNQEEDYTYYPTTTTQSYKGSYNGQAIQKKSRNTNWQWDNTLTYEKLIQEKHKISALLGMNASFYSNTWNNISAANFGNDLFSYKKIDGATDKTLTYVSSDFSSYSMESYFTRFNYVYDSRYYITFTGRLDGSSRFGPSNKWGVFPSISGSWNITGEEFMKNQHVFDNLRLRTGYGLAGNQNIPNYGYMTIYSPIASLGSSVLANGGTYGNPDLHWETQKQLNLGLDVSVLKNRINLTVDMFHIINDGLLMTRSMPASAGYLYKLDNVGTLENKGIEISLNVTAIKTQDFNWDFTLNLSSDRNKVLKLYDNMTALYNLGGYSNNEIQREGNLFVGQPINNIYVYKFDRIVQQSDMAYVNTLNLGSRIVKPGDILPLDKDGNGIINDADRYVVGKKDPDFYGGLTTNFSYKGLSINIVANYSVGGKRISYLYETLMSGYGTSATSVDMLNRWTPDNTNTNIPRAYSDAGRFNLSDVDWAVQDASFLRLSAVTISYTLPKKWMKTIFVDNLRLYATGTNMLTLSKYKGFDPETGDWYPNSKMIVVGLNLSL